MPTQPHPALNHSPSQRLHQRNVLETKNVVGGCFNATLNPKAAGCQKADQTVLSSQENVWNWCLLPHGELSSQDKCSAKRKRENILFWRYRFLHPMFAEREKKQLRGKPEIISFK